jgi:hypothetical protein
MNLTPELVVYVEERNPGKIRIIPSKKSAVFSRM